MQKTLTGILMIMAIILGVCGGWVTARAAGSGYYDLGVFAYEEGDYKTAESDFLKALAADPYDIDIYHYLGKTYLHLEQPGKAAHYLLAVKKIAPDRPGLTADLALLNMQEKNYAKAVYLFDKVISENPEDVLSVYRGGICAYRMGRFSDALIRLSKAASMSPSVKPNADYYAGICAYKIGDMNVAFEKFSMVRLTAVSDKLKADAEKWLDVIEAEKASMKPYFLYASAGVTYDDNVVLDPMDADLFHHQGDFSAVGYVSGRYNLINQRDFKTGIGYSHYQTHHSRWRDYDIAGSIGDFFVQYRAGRCRLGLRYLPSYYWVQAESFLARNDVTPEVSWNVNEATTASLSYTYRHNNYFTDPGRDGHANIGSLDFVRALPDKIGSLSGQLSYEKNYARSSDEDYGQFEAGAGLNLRIMDMTVLSLSAIFDSKHYDSKDSVFGVKRRDSRYYAGLSLTRSIFYDWLSISLDLDHTFNDSNIKYYKYRRNTVSFSVAANL